MRPAVLLPWLQATSSGLKVLWACSQDAWTLLTCCLGLWALSQYHLVEAITFVPSLEGMQYHCMVPTAPWSPAVEHMGWGVRSCIQHPYSLAPAGTLLHIILLSGSCPLVS